MSKHKGDWRPAYLPKLSKSDTVYVVVGLDIMEMSSQVEMDKQTGM